MYVEVDMSQPIIWLRPISSWEGAGDFLGTGTFADSRRIFVHLSFCSVVDGAVCRSKHE